MAFLKKVKSKRHSKKFLEVIASPIGKEAAIKAITHKSPLLVFWITPDREVLDAGKDHRSNPPKGDKEVFTDDNYKGHLRGRIAMFGNVCYVVVYYSAHKNALTNKQLALLRSTYPVILNTAIQKNPKQKEQIQDAIFVGEDGQVLIG